MNPVAKQPKSLPKVSSRGHLADTSPRVPKLRFKGFDGEWESVCFGDVVKRIVRRNGGTTDIPLTISAQYGLIDQREFFSKSVASSDMSGYYLLKRGEFAYNRSSSNGYPFGSVKRLERYAEGAVSTLYICFQTICDTMSHEFLKWYFESKIWNREVGKVCAEGARNHGLLNVATEDFFGLKINWPTVGDEKGKIALFLSILDARIDAQRRLVELLKKHKRGVIERIFGHGISRGVEHEKKVVCLRDLFKKVSRRNRDGAIKNVVTNSAVFGLMPQTDFFDKSIAVDGNTYGYYVVQHGDFVYNPRKSKVAPFGPFNRYDRLEDGIVSPLYTCLSLIADVNSNYLAWYFRSAAWHRYVYDNGSQGARHDRVNMTDDLLFGIPVVLPPKHTQEQIAEFLNALNERVRCEEKRLLLGESLKQGLLQSLFA